MVMDLRITHDRSGSSSDPSIIITIPLALSPLCLLLIARLGGYTVNLCVFYFYKFIGKLTSFLHLQEFSWWNITVTSSTMPTVVSLQLKSNVGNILTKVDELRITLNIDGTPVTSRSHTPWHLTHNLSFINLVSIFRCSSPPLHPVYTRRVDPSALPFSLSSHRKSHTSLLFSFRFID